MVTKLVRVVTCIEGFLPIKLHHKLKTYLSYHNEYGQQTWEGSEIPGALTHKVT